MIDRRRSLSPSFVVPFARLPYQLFLVRAVSELAFSSSIPFSTRSSLGRFSSSPSVRFCDLGHGVSVADLRTLPLVSGDKAYFLGLSFRRVRRLLVAALIL